MKVAFQNGITGFSGRAGDLIFCYNKLFQTVYARRNTYPARTQENERIGRITGHLYKLQISEDYKEDMRLYLTRYNALRENHRQPLPNWSSLYLKLMYKMTKAMPELDLSTITRDQIHSLELPCISIKKAIEAGLLPKVLGWQRYTNLF